MARTKGTANLSGTIEALAGGPLDARSVVPTKADLTVGSNFPYPYIGLETYVTAENKKYRLVGDDPTVEANWEEVGSGGSSVPSGGTTGQALVKHSATDGDVEWASVIPASAKGTASGVAELDSNGKVPASQLPSYVDDVIEGYYNSTNDRFYEESTFTTLIPPESGKSWVDIAGNKSYRWSGSAYVRVDEGVQLGETSDTAYRGDRGKTAYDFSQAPYTSTPAMDGTGSAGSSTKWAKGDHVHPKDTTKADKVSGATSGHLASLNSSGNLTDSGKALSDLQAKLTAGDGITINSSTNTISADVNYLIGAYDIYDSTERVVGYYYGKPLYRKTLTGSFATTSPMAITFSSANKIVNMKGIYYDGSSCAGINVYFYPPGGSNSTSWANAWYDGSAGKIKIELGAEQQKTTITYYLTVEYTKNADSTSSVSYGHENQYSTSEQIVGTWIDGKPLYQKTFQTGAIGGTNKSVNHGITNLSLVVDVEGVFINSSGISACTSGSYWFNGTNNYFVINYTSTQLTINAGSGFNWASDSYVTIQYTKTT